MISTPLEWLESPADLDPYSVDFGSLYTYTPRKVARPRSTNDLLAVVQLARDEGVKIAARGMAHSTGGQPLAQDGYVLDMRGMTSIDSPIGESVWVDAGATWRELIAATIPAGLTPPVLTDYIDVTIGGTISVGGVGAQTFKYGTQTDNVLELEVVTGRGEVVLCSPTQNTDLFNGVRAGLGQFGIITRARLTLIPAPRSVRFHRLFFGDLSRFYEALTTLIDSDIFGGVQGFGVMNDPTHIQGLIDQYPNETTGSRVDQMERPAATWLYMIEIGEYARSVAPAPTQTPPTKVLSSLGTLSGGHFEWEMSYHDYAARLTKPMDDLRAFGIWDKPHPWINLMVSGENAPAFLGEALSDLNPMEAGAVLIYAYRRERLHTPLFRLPDAPLNSRHVIKLALLRTAMSAEHAEKLTHDNRVLYELCLRYGGVRYAVDGVPMRPGDWSRQFGSAWKTVQTLKTEYDPDHLLAPHQGVFE